MRSVVSGYYVLEEPKKSSFSKFTNSLILLANWIFSYIARRAIINIAVGPDEIKLQKPIHVMFLTDDRTEKGTVVVNVLPGKFNKPVRSYFDKMPSSATEMKRQLSFDKPSHKTYVDFIIDEIGNLLAGTSKQDKCVNKKFAIEEIHLKGIERLDERLKCYFEEQVRQKYGEEFFELPRKVNLDFYSLETTDNAILESVELAESDEKLKPNSERKYVIACMARNQNYMFWLKDFYISSKNIGCTVIGFNYRGIDYSKGFINTETSMVNDALSQAQRLLESGVKPENIGFEGMSLGAAIATLTAATMHDRGLKVKLYNERSYRSLIRLIIGYVMPEANCNPLDPLNWLKYMAVGFTYLTIAPLVWLAGWHIDAASAWDRIPLEYKDYTVARNHKNPDHYDDDDMVHDSFSSIASLMAEHVNEIKEKHRTGLALSLEEQRLLADNAESHEFTLDRDNKINTNPSTHSAPRRFLVDTQTHKKNMQDYMIESMSFMLGSKSAITDTRDLNELKDSSVIRESLTNGL